jgi:hypothetical protein
MAKKQRHRTPKLKSANWRGIGWHVSYAATYEFVAQAARLERVTGPGLPAGANGGAWYAYMDGADLVQKLRYKDASGTLKALTVRQYEPCRDLITV